MSTLFQRANGHSYIAVELNDGSRRWISTKTKNRSAALRKLGEEESNPITVSAMKLSEFKEEFLAHSKTVFSLGTNKIYRQALMHFEKIAGDFCLDAVKPKHIDSFKSERLRTVRPPTLNIELRTIRSAFYSAQRWGYMKDNSFRGVKQCRVEEMTPLFITEVDAKRIIEAVRECWMKDAIALALCAGLRCGEITGPFLTQNEYSTFQEAVTVPAGINTFNVTLVKGATIVGNVTNSLTANAVGGASLSIGTVGGTTDNPRNFKLHPVDPTLTSLSISSTGYYSTSETVSLQSNETSFESVSLTPLPMISGAVVDSASAANLSGVRIEMGSVFT